jgi:energy-coupling factor transporter ATP-binding protein EcfA2
METLRITLEHVRCFAEETTFPVHPLTLLVGENSSGKSTFLAIAAAILDQNNFPGSPDFNAAPYQLGTFETITTFKGGRYGRDNDFSIGFEVPTKPDIQPRKVVATYKNDNGVPVLSQLNSWTNSSRMVINIGESKIKGEVELSQPDSPKDIFKFESQTARRFPAVSSGGHAFMNYLLNLIVEGSQHPRKEFHGATFDKLIHAVDSFRPPGRGSFSFAPIRSKPKRTYDEFTTDKSPEGDHIPSLLARLLDKDSPVKRRILNALEDFGAESGLFERIDVKRFSKQSGSPIQIQIITSGPPTNLADVGYGVSQSLPIIAQNALEPSNINMLLQQPEVHLHPRAQAALGTFFARLVGRRRKPPFYLIETHSDYFVDRIRQEVARKTLRPSDVIILFFRKYKLETRIYPISLDENGNVLNAPMHYRDFFMQEELNLFNRTTN